MAQHQVNYVGASIRSAEDYKLRAGMDKIARDVFGTGARVKRGQVTKFYDAVFRVLDAAAMQARQILRAQTAQLASLVEVREE